MGISGEDRWCRWSENREEEGEQSWVAKVRWGGERRGMSKCEEGFEREERVQRRWEGAWVRTVR